jgi:2-polyprenyl-3-methyl-5-hydroxy-6-metoxy-1,4-benzoquinol methylase
MRVVGVTNVRRISDEWLTRFGINVSEEFQGTEQLIRKACQGCSLEFYTPFVAGSPILYSELERFEWYYMESKWEHDVALEDVLRGGRVLEIGCGKGAFVRRLIDENVAEAMGTELNESAVAFARRAGIPVLCASLKELGHQHQGVYDTVCSFQVLEHVPDPAEFIRASVELLRSGGRLTVVVPNNKGFIGFNSTGLLNQPPHHVTLWSKSVMEALPNFFPIKLRRLLYEPLAECHADWYIDIQLSRLPQFPILSKGVSRLARRMVRPLVHREGMRRWLRGHSLYACYERL